MTQWIAVYLSVSETPSYVVNNECCRVATSYLVQIWIAVMSVELEYGVCACAMEHSGSRHFGIVNSCYWTPLSASNCASFGLSVSLFSVSDCQVRLAVMFLSLSPSRLVCPPVQGGLAPSSWLPLPARPEGRRDTPSPQQVSLHLTVVCVCPHLIWQWVQWEVEGIASSFYTLQSSLQYAIVIIAN